MMHPGVKHLDPKIRKLWHQSARRQQRIRQWHRIEQALILVLSAAAIALVDLGHTTQLRFWGNAIGLAAQPLWFASTIRHRQWGMLALAVFYAGIWSAGAIKHY